MACVILCKRCLHDKWVYDKKRHSEYPTEPSSMFQKCERCGAMYCCANRQYVINADSDRIKRYKKKIAEEKGYFTEEILKEMLDGLDGLTPEDYDDIFKNLKDLREDD